MLRKSTFSEWKNFWCYYKFHVLFSILAIALIAFCFWDISSAKPIAFNAVLFDSDCQNSMYKSEFAVFANINLDSEDILIKDNIPLYPTEANMQASGLMYLSQRMMAGEMDVAVLAPDEFNTLGTDYFVDLRTCLDVETLDLVKNDLYYIDGICDETGNPIPIGIQLDRCSYFLESYYYRGCDCVLGVCINANNFENINRFVEFLFTCQ